MLILNMQTHWPIDFTFRNPVVRNTTENVSILGIGDTLLTGSP